jgi:hypothetical protein
MTSEPRRGNIRANAIDVRLLVWGLTEADQEGAVDRAGQGWSRKAWEFVETERLASDVCPLNLKDAKSIAADAGKGWAYIVYPARCS